MRACSVITLLLGLCGTVVVGPEASPAACELGDNACVRSDLERSVAAGDVASKTGLALLLLEEPEQSSNWSRAAGLLQQAANTGDPWSTNILAGVYLQGKGVPANGQMVMALLIPLAADGNGAALSGLGDLFAQGAGTIAQDLPRAERYYTRAAAKGDTHGKYRLAMMLLDGDAVDVAKSVGLFEELAAAGDPWMSIQLGEIYASGKAAPAERAIDYFATAAATGNGSAMVRMAQLYQSGIGTVAPDAKRARDLLEKAAALGDMGAQVGLAQMLYASADAGASKRAIGLLEGAVASGELYPTLVLANILANGAKVDLDVPLAVALLQPFAARGNAAALVGLGDIYAKGGGTVSANLRLARALFSKAAALDDPAAQNRLGFMLLNGQGGAADASRGLALLEPIMSGKDTWAMLQLADVFAQGVAVPQSGAKAKQYFERAAELGNAAGLSRLGALYRDGLGEISADRALALDYFERAVAEEDETGRIYLAMMLLEEGVSQDVDRAVTLLDAAAGTGSAWATTILADLLIKGDRVDADGQRALALLEPLAAQNNAAALAGLGNLYQAGAGTVPADLPKAHGYFEDAAALGDFGAKSRLGMMLIKGEGGPADTGRGLTLLREVAAIGDGWAKIQLGEVLTSGKEAPVDAEGALDAFMAARETGLPAAAIKLGYLYLSGAGTIEADPARAAAYFTEAADSGDSTGQISLALLLLEGKGVDKDVERALGLLRLAAGTGSAWANGALGGVYADGRNLDPDYVQARQFSAAAQTAGDDTAMLRLGMLLATGPLAGEHAGEGVKLVEASVADELPGAVVGRARLRFMGLMGSNGAVAAESELRSEVEAGDPAALRLLLQMYRAGGAGLKASPRKAQSLLDANAALLTPQAVAFETIALRAVTPATEQSLADIGAALHDIARPDFSQTLQMLFWGNKNAYVYALQQELQYAGFYTGPLSGYLTKETISAINRACVQEHVEKTCAQGPLTPDVATLLGDYLASRPQNL